jgi:hypothetical protein
MLNTQRSSSQDLELSLALSAVSVRSDMQSSFKASSTNLHVFNGDSDANGFIKESSKPRHSPKSLQVFKGDTDVMDAVEELLAVLSSRAGAGKVGRASVGIVGCDFCAFEGAIFPVVAALTVDDLSSDIGEIAVGFGLFLICHLFLTALSERPGKNLAILAH